VLQTPSVGFFPKQGPPPPPPKLYWTPFWGTVLGPFDRSSQKPVFFGRSFSCFYVNLSGFCFPLDRLAVFSTVIRCANPVRSSFIPRFEAPRFRFFLYEGARLFCFYDGQRCPWTRFPRLFVRRSPHFDIFQFALFCWRFVTPHSLF